MENYIKNINDLKCIKVSHTSCTGEVINNRISFNEYYRSFVVERWTGERRSNKKYTLFGYWHTKTTVPNPYSNEKSIRVFTFPESEAEARQLDDEYYKELEKGGL